tara:strand:+ start:3909 stop:4790 length:882 start_codon:yes stop_codon:yes gene_type:complete
MIEQEITEMCIFYNWFPVIANHCIDFSQEYYKSAGISRPHSHPPFNPDNLEAGDILFVKTDFIYDGQFQRNFLPHIKKPFVLISGASSYQVGSNGDHSYKQILKNKNLIKWFCTNPPEETHVKISSLPIGFEERERAGGNQFLLEMLKAEATEYHKKKNKILLPYHNFATNPDRQKLFESLCSNPDVEVQKEKLNFEEYMRLLGEYKFIICLPGRGHDIHRNYESLLMNSVPINIRNNLEQMFTEANLPNIFLDSWKNLNFKDINGMVSDDQLKNAKEFLKIKYHIKRIKNEN